MNCKLFLFFIIFFPFFGKAQFQVKLKVTNMQDTVAYFRASIFDDKNYIPKDTLFLKKSNHIIKNLKPIFGGIYFLYFPGTKQKISFVIENKDSIIINLTGTNYLSSVNISKTRNQIFLAYQKLERSLSHYDSSYAASLKSGQKFSQAKKAAYFKVKADSLTAFRTEALKKLKKDEVLYLHFKTLNQLDAVVPNKRDYATRDLYFSSYDLNTPKLFFTPNIKPILVEYFSFYPLQADSINKGVDTVFSKLLCTSKTYSFVFDYISKLLKSREIQHNTEGYANFIDRYVKNGKCAFLEKSQKEAFLTELSQLQAQKLKDTCVNIILPDTSGKQQNLHEFASHYNYTVVTFFDPSCEHCKVEVPKMDSTIALLEQQLLVKIGKYAVCNAPGASPKEWTDFILTHKLNMDYAHVQLGNDLAIRKAYDAFSNPLFYLIDKEGILLAKKISPATLRKELVQAFQNFK